MCEHFNIIIYMQIPEGTDQNDCGGGHGPANDYRYFVSETKSEVIFHLLRKKYFLEAKKYLQFQIFQIDILKKDFIE